MAHGYSLRPNSKGRRKHQSTDEIDDQVEDTSASTSMSTSSTSLSEGQHRTLTGELKGKSGTVNPCPATPDTPRTVHNSPWHSCNIVTSSAISAPTTTRYRVEGPPDEIRAARKREKARRTAEADRIRREQIVRGYEEELRALHARIGALRRECEVRVERGRRKSERKWAIERGEVVVVVVEDDGDGEEGNLVDLDAESDREDVDGGEMAVDKHNAQMVTMSLTTNNDDNKQRDSGNGHPDHHHLHKVCLIAPTAIPHHHHHHPTGKPNSSRTTKGGRRGRFALSPTLGDDSCGRTIQVRVGHLLIVGLGLITLSRCSASQHSW